MFVIVARISQTSPSLHVIFPLFTDMFCMWVNKNTAQILNDDECILGHNLAFVQVEIVMGLEEEFGISVEEESAQSISTVQDAADMIDKLLESKSA